MIHIKQNIHLFKRYRTLAAIFLFSLFCCSSVADASEPGFEIINGTSLRITHDGQFLDVSLTRPRFVFNIASTAEGVAPVSIVGDIASGQVVTASYNTVALNGFVSMESQLLLQWSSTEGIIRKWARYRFSGNLNNVVLQEIVLEKIAQSLLSAMPLSNSPQSYPAFANGFFLGIEFPVASTRIESQNLILAHKPGFRPVPNVWYESRRAIYGTAASGNERKAFLDYITLHRPEPAGLHINYNSWWSAPATTETNILALMQQFKNNLTTPYGVSFDTFTIDHGWSNPQSIWQMDTSNFPNGFVNLKNYAQTTGMSLGLWSSPSAAYPGALDTTWAMNQGYETAIYGTSRICCMAGPLYNTAYTSQLVNLTNLYSLEQYKFDGYYLECPATNHGHEPDGLSSEALAQAGINTFQAVHAASPNAWLETTCFSYGSVGSPWWLFYVNSIIGAFGDDSPAGKIPCPIYRESYTTARDYYNLQGASLAPVPIAGQEVLGIVHQTSESFLNDGVITVMRGHAFLPLYINPNYMSGRWSALAELLTWARNNSDIILANTYPLIPTSWQNGNVPNFTAWTVMPREIYGYAHCVNNQGLIVLRNPWIKPQTYTLTLNNAIGFSSQASGLSVVSLYPETRVYGQNLNYGSTLTFPVAPYETVALTAGPGYNLNGIPTVGESVGGQLQTSVTGSCVRSSFAINLQATVDSIVPNAKLLVLMEGTAALAIPAYQYLKVNGVPASVQIISSEDGWRATGIPVWEHWLFLQVNLPSAHSEISLQQLQPDLNCTNVSIWAWATKNGSGTSSFPNSLPSPELISLDAALLGNFYRNSVSLGDLNDDCNVNLADLEIFVNQWLEGTGSVPVSSRIESNKIAATASSSVSPYNPTLTVDCSGLFVGPYPTVDYNPVGGYHDPLANSAWLSNNRGANDSAAAGTAVGEEWLLYEFDKIYALDEMLVWNYNFSGRLDRGLKEVYIEYSVDGVNWTRLMGGSNDYWTFAQANGGWFYLSNTTVNFGGFAAKFVAITPKTDGVGQWGGDGYYGLSELQFYGTDSVLSGDLDGDGDVDIVDFSILAENWRLLGVN